MLAACRGHNGPDDPPDASVDAAALLVDGALVLVDAPPVLADAAPDAPVAPGLVLDVSAGAAPIAAWQFPTTAIAQHAGVTLVVHNGGTTSTGVLAVTLAGDNATDFSIVSAGSTCDGKELVPGDLCVVRLGFAPSTTGTRAAALRFTAAAATFDFALAGDGVAAAPGLVADATSIDFGPVSTSAPATATVQLRNTGTTAITLGARSVAAPFSISASTCLAALVAGAVCTVTVRFTPTAAGLATASLNIPSSANSVSVAVTGLGLRRVFVSVVGAGTGTITSLPTGISCGTTCDGLFLGAVTLTATPSGADHFAGWSQPCSTGAACALVFSSSEAATARFEAADAKAVTVTYAGPALGFVVIRDAAPPSENPAINCTSSCTTYYPAGTDVTVSGFTPSTFAGWTGDCASTTDNECLLGPVVTDRAATVTFNRDPLEVATLLPSATVNGVAIAPDGDVIIGNATGVTKMSPTGTVAWTSPIAGGGHELATDAAGNVLVAGSAGLFALSPAGVLRWTQPVTITYHGELTLQSSIAVSPDGTVIAVLTSGGVRVFNGDGGDRFTVTAPVQAIAVAADGVVACAVQGAFPFQEQMDVRRFNASGTELTTIAPLAGRSSPALAYDALGFLYADTSGHGGATVSRTAPDGHTVFSQDDQTGASAGLATGVGADTASNLLAVRAMADEAVPGLQIDVFSPTGTRSFTLSKPDIRREGPIFDDGVSPLVFSGVVGKRFAVAGFYNFSTPWLQIFDLP